MRVDFHTHFMPPRYIELMFELGAFDILPSLKAISPIMARGYAGQMFIDGEQAFIDRWIQDMDSCGVDVIVNSIGLQPYFPQKESAVTAARLANDMFADAVKMGAGRIKALGTLPLPHTASAVDEVAYCMDTLGFVGVNLGCSVDGRPLDDPEFEPVWAALNDRKAAVYIHPGQTPTMGVGSGDFALGMTFASPMELALAMCRLVLTKTTLKFPDVRIIGAGFGGATPYFFERLRSHVMLMFGVLYDELDGILPHLQRFWYDTGFEDQLVYQAFQRTIGVDRIILGSDSPRISIARAVDLVEQSEFLSASEKALILDYNGAAALGLPSMATA